MKILNKVGKKFNCDLTEFYAEDDSYCEIDSSLLPQCLLYRDATIRANSKGAVENETCPFKYWVDS